MLMCKQPDILEREKIHFAVMAIEAGAREMGSFEKLGSTGGRKSMKITLYHGSTLSIEHPLAKVGRADLDFGNVCSISNSLIHSYILIRVFHWIQWTEKEVINERTSTLEKNKSYHPIIIGPIGDKPGTSIKSVL